MKTPECDAVFYRVWIGRYSRWNPRHWSDVPPQAEAVEPVDARILPREAARQVVEGFNREKLQHADRFWAIAVPVRLRIDGEPRRGDTVTSGELRSVAAGKVAPVPPRSRPYQGLFQSPQRSR